MTRLKLIIKNISCQCCVKLVKRIFKDAGIDVHHVDLGEADISFDPERMCLEQISKLLAEEGFELLHDKEDKLVEQIKSAVINLVQYSTYNSMVRNSDYLVERFNLSYQHISTIFSRHEHQTLEKFIIQQKIEKVKELIRQGELSLGEIAYMMGYSSVQYLSTQFKTVTGITVSEFKKTPDQPLSNLPD
jgi:AraC family transcriptional regulator